MHSYLSYECSSEVFDLTAPATPPRFFTESLNRPAARAKFPTLVGSVSPLCTQLLVFAHVVSSLRCRHWSCVTLTIFYIRGNSVLPVARRLIGCRRNPTKQMQPEMIRHVGPLVLRPRQAGVGGLLFWPPPPRPKGRGRRPDPQTVGPWNDDTVQ